MSKACGADVGTPNSTAGAYLVAPVLQSIYVKPVEIPAIGPDFKSGLRPLSPDGICRIVPLVHR